MGFDFTMRDRGRAQDDDINPRFRLNIGAMSLMLDLLTEQGAIDWDNHGPTRPPSGLDSDEHDERFDQGMMRWHAEQEQKVRNADPARQLQVPGVKFSSNDDWQIFPRECEEIARALRLVDEQQCKKVIVEDEAEVRALEAEHRDEGRSGSPDFDQAARNLLEAAEQYARYCEKAASYGGLKVS